MTSNAAETKTSHKESDAASGPETRAENRQASETGSDKPSTSGKSGAAAAGSSAGAKKATAKGTSAAAKKDATKSASASGSKQALDASGNVLALHEGAAHSASEALNTMAGLSADGAERLTQGVHVAARLAGESMLMGREHMEACVEAGNIAAGCASSFSERMMQAANEAATNNVEISKDFFNCRNASDVFELQSRLAQSNTQRWFEESTHMMNLWFDMGTKASGPFHDHLSDATDRMNKVFQYK